MTSSTDQLLRFAAASFPSVWALELLLVLKRERRPWPHDELVTALRASDLVVSNALDALVAGGLASIEPAGAVYLPANEETEAMVRGLERLYQSRANAVRRAIVSSATGSATAFAEAFRLRRGKDD
ncbi:MAG TPA: hypothetical protein VM308_07190 [Sphingomicrobium sp.]|nr:hypothetical protein [Sphingomicrobium sp.]